CEAADATGGGLAHGGSNPGIMKPTTVEGVLRIQGGGGPGPGPGVGGICSFIYWSNVDDVSINLPASSGIIVTNLRTGTKASLFAANVSGTLGDLQCGDTVHIEYVGLPMARGPLTFTTPPPAGFTPLTI